MIKRNADMGIVYTPLHGTGYKMVPEALAMYGFTNVHSVREQSITDGNFPTLRSPNPEEPGCPCHGCLTWHARRVLTW